LLDGLAGEDSYGDVANGTIETRTATARPWRRSDERTDVAGSPRSQIAGCHSRDSIFPQVEPGIGRWASSLGGRGSLLVSRFLLLRRGKKEKRLHSSRRNPPGDSWVTLASDFGKAGGFSWRAGGSRSQRRRAVSRRMHRRSIQGLSLPPTSSPAIRRLPASPAGDRSVQSEARMKRTPAGVCVDVAPC